MKEVALISGRQRDKENNTISHKQIIFTHNYAANYILHIFAVAKIRYDSEYADRYRLTVQPQDLEHLESHRYLLEFGDGQTGPFASFCFFLPAYLDLKTKDGFTDYYHSLINSLENNDFSEFLQRYPIDWGDPFLSAYYQIFRVKMSDEEWGKTMLPLMPGFREVAQIFINNIDGYESVWKRVEPVLKERAEKWNKYFDKSNIIQEWERITEKTFLKDKYYILLCYASNNGPDANSLSYDKNIFYYDSPDEYIREFVSHEVGTHLLFVSFGLFLSGEFDPVKYSTLECLAMFFNLKVLKVEGLSYALSQFQCNKFLSLYDKHYYKGITPEKLVGLALKEIK